MSKAKVEVERAAATGEDRVREVFEAQRAHRWAMAATTAGDRVRMLERLERAILARRDDLFGAMRADLHKPAPEVELTELQPVLAEISHTAKHLRRWMRPVHVETPLTLTGTRSEVRYEPKGVVLVLAPWNYPFNLMLSPLVAALAAGNCAVLKPSEKTPNVSAVIRAIVEETFEEREVAVFEGDAGVAEALLQLPFDHIFFTGSTRIGKVVMRAAAEHLASVTLELGGKSPVVVAEDADVRKAARSVTWGKFINAGQTCVAPDYALVHESVAEAFVEEARRAVASFYGESEDARRRTADLCRIVDEGSFDRLSSLLDDAVARGATVELGGVCDRDERYVAPTILTGVDTSMRVMEEEIFGPILPILTYRTLGEAIDVVRSGGKPLALYVFSGRRATVEEVVSKTTSGGAAVNNVVIHLANPNLPFGGVGESGLGSYHGEFGFRTFSHERAVLRQGRANLFAAFYPPYTRRVERMVRFVTRFLT